MNLHLVEGVLDELDDSGYAAQLRPSADNCCVVLELVGRDGSSR